MYDDYSNDYDLEYDFTDLEEYYLDADEDYARDSYDLEALAYRHYAW